MTAELITIIAVPLCGFANRLKFLSCVHALAKKFKVKDIRVIWRQTMDCNIAFQDIFKSIKGLQQIDDKSLPDNEKILYYGYVHVNQILETINDDLKDDKNKSKTCLLIEGGHEFKHPNMTCCEFAKFKSKFYKNIIWSEPLQKKLKNSSEDIPSIGVHYRHVNKDTDDADVKANRLVNFSQNSPFGEFENFISKTKTKVFFISNSFYHKRYISENYSNKALVINPTESNNRSSCDSMLESIYEFILLSRCELIVGSYYSSFSDEASYFNFVPKLIPLSPSIAVEKSSIQYFRNNYHSVCKPFEFEKYLVLNPCIRKMIEFL